MNPKLLTKYVKVFKKKEEQRVREIDAFSYNLARYIGIAVNNPKKFPPKPLLEKPPKPKKMTVEQMQEILKKNTLMLGGKIVNHGTNG